MNRGRMYQRTLGLTLALLFLVGCGGAPAEPTPTATPVPLTATPTAGPPSATPTLAPPTATHTAEPPTTTPTPDFTLATSIEDILGTWHRPGKDSYIGFYDDGTWHQAHALDALDDSPYAICEIWFEGTQMLTKEISVSGVPSCGDAIAIYEVRLYEGDRIKIRAIEDDCSPRKRDTATTFDRVPATPTPPPVATSTPVFSLATSIGEIAGTWRKAAGVGYIGFYEDGIWRQARTLDALDDRPFAICEIWFEGTQLMVGQCTVFGVPPCGDAIAIYEARLLPGDGLRLVAIEDSCAPRMHDTATTYEAVR